ncbi:MAG: NADH-quinone oxidoreductase subunit J [Actinobacteria bacterium]|nr:MAG: NADH-quinone oxidoreductase subunit J [Actinomycetota bacterium]
MTFADWISAPVNWVFLAIGLIVLLSGFRVVTSKNVVHAALFLVGALAGTAGLFLMLSAEFVAWVLVLVYIGAVIVLFLFGIMITRAPTGLDEGLDSDNKALPALLSLGLFVLLAWSSVAAFGGEEVASLGEPTSTETIATSLIGRFVIPFEVVSFVLLAALIGGITIARRDLTPLEEEERASV